MLGYDLGSLWYFMPRKKWVVGFLVLYNCKVVIYLYHICLIFEVLDQSLHVQEGRQKTGLHISYQLGHSPVLPEGYWKSRMWILNPKNVMVVERHQQPLKVINFGWNMCLQQFLLSACRPPAIECQTWCCMSRLLRSTPCVLWTWQLWICMKLRIAQCMNCDSSATGIRLATEDHEDKDNW